MFAVRSSSPGVNDGNVVLTLSDAAQWTVVWEKKEGAVYNVVAGTVAPDNSFLLSNQGDGIYRYTATRGVESVVRDFVIVNRYIPAYNISVENPDACDCINIAINNLTDTKPDFFDELVFAGVNNFELLRSGGSIVSVPSDILLTSVQDCDMSPFEVDYQLRYTDAFGFEWLSDIINFHSRVPSVLFDASPSKGEAPLEVSFSNGSENADSYNWFLYKDFSTLDALAGLQDSLWIPVDSKEELSYIYEHPGKYVVRLVAINTSGLNQCKREYMLDGEMRIVVDSSLVQVPNVFTPNGDGHNDVFRVKALSLKSFHGVILNRHGKKVYEWTDPQGGWNGRIGGSYATPGTYFYIIEAVGAEQDNKKYVKKGTVLLIRER